MCERLITNVDIGKRIGIVYLLRDIQTGIPFYIGSTIDLYHRKLDHSPNYRSKYTNPSAIKHYIIRNNIQYEFEEIHRVIGLKSEILPIIRRLEQKCILESVYPLINKQNPLSYITKYKKKYPWLSNKSLLKTIVKY